MKKKNNKNGESANEKDLTGTARRSRWLGEPAGNVDNGYNQWAKQMNVSLLHKKLDDGEMRLLKKGGAS
jgi:hypothetical protein